MIAYEYIVSKPATVSRVRIAHAAIGIGALALLITLLTVTNSFNFIGQPLGSPVLAVLIMAELVRFVLIQRWQEAGADICYNYNAAQSPPPPMFGQQKSTYMMKSPPPHARLASIGQGLALLAAAVAVAFLVCLLFGAPLADSYAGTLQLSVILVVSSVLPLVLYLGPMGTLQLALCDQFRLAQPQQEAYVDAVLRVAACTAVGAWASSVAATLDWDRDWQRWPVANVYGALIGMAVGNAATLVWRLVEKMQFWRKELMHLTSVKSE